jgi:hypothetical protein
LILFLSLMAIVIPSINLTGQSKLFPYYRY